MAKLVITRGLPAAGKSTWAMEQVKADHTNTVRVNRDLLRTMINADKWEGRDSEKPITTARDELIKKFLRQNKTVINDDTNLDPKVVRSLSRLAIHEGAGFEVVDFDTPLSVCYKRNRDRGFPVDDSVITSMHNRHFKYDAFPANPIEDAIEEVKFEPYKWDCTKERAVVVDIDGTVAKHVDRSPYDYSKLSTDEPVWQIVDILESLHETGFKIVFVSGRPDTYFRETRDWIENNCFVGNFRLYMRPADDKRSDHVVKYILFRDKVSAEFNVRAVFDDRQRVIDMWRQIGLVVCDVAGNTF